MIPVQLRFVVEGIDVAQSTDQADLDCPPGAGGQFRRCAGPVAEQLGDGDRPQTMAAEVQKSATVDLVFWGQHGIHSMMMKSLMLNNARQSACRPCWRRSSNERPR